jgi:hypothetical protein
LWPYSRQMKAMSPKGMESTPTTYKMGSTDQVIQRGQRLSLMRLVALHWIHCGFSITRNSTC